MAGNRAAVTSRTMSLCSLKKKESPRIISAEAPRSLNWSSAGPIASRLSASAVSTPTPSAAVAFLIDDNCSSLLGLRGFPQHSNSHHVGKRLFQQAEALSVEFK